MYLRENVEADSLFTVVRRGWVEKKNDVL